MTCLSIQTPPQDTELSQLRDFWQAADSLGFYAAYTYDHLVPLLPGEGPTHQPRALRTGHQFEGWTVAAALGAATRRLRVGTLVSDVTMRPPALLAKLAVTLDHLTDGRAVLGVGAGWHAEEHRMFGIPLPPAGHRVDLLEDALAIAKILMTCRAPVDYAGRTVALDGAYFEPKPVQDRLPVLVGGSGSRVIELAARYADGLNSFASPEGWPALNADLDARLGRYGRRPEELRRSAYVFADLSGIKDREARLAQLIAERSGVSFGQAQNRIVTADPERSFQVFRAFAAAGVDEVVLGLAPPYEPDALERFASCVVPELTTLSAKEASCST
jgi:alkanesulfonate monooxygenase SsuD/methylene tetrahydromethanopterin reductase-like flavin-dependent oxidoreductase (luciferase family)